MKGGTEGWQTGLNRNFRLELELQTRVRVDGSGRKRGL